MITAEQQYKRLERTSPKRAEQRGLIRKSIWRLSGYTGTTKDFLIWQSAKWEIFKHSKYERFNDFLLMTANDNFKRNLNKDIMEKETT